MGGAAASAVFGITKFLNDNVDIKDKNIVIIISDYGGKYDDTIYNDKWLNKNDKYDRGRVKFYLSEFYDF